MNGSGRIRKDQEGSGIDYTGISMDSGKIGLHGK
jgi:hypothetical protein